MVGSRTRLQRLFSQLCAATPAPPTSDTNDKNERAAFLQYCEEGRARALALGNRGPIRFGPDGKLAKEILDKYYEVGFYVLTGVVSSDEMRGLQEELEELLDNAPVVKGGKVDKHGQPVRRPEAYRGAMAKPLSDPIGGTSKVGIWDWKKGTPYLDKWGRNGRSHLKMREPKPPPGAPQLIPATIPHALAYSDAALRIYGHPNMLRVAEALSGPDMAPFSESFFAKPPFLGTSSAWHQDPSSAWDTEGWGEPGFDLGTCGFNFHLSIYHGTPENTLWFLPGSPKLGRVDMQSLRESGDGSDRLPGMVPILCEPGDVYIQSRLGLHGAFPNQSPHWRATLQWGFHRRSTLLGKVMYNKTVYTAELLAKRSRMIQLAIDARRQTYPEETPYVYQPFLGKEDKCRWDEAKRAELKEDLMADYLTI